MAALLILLTQRNSVLKACKVSLDTVNEYPKRDVMILDPLLKHAEAAEQVHVRNPSKTLFPLRLQFSIL